MNETPPKGTSIDYCLECAEKHLQTATILLKEAIQRAQQCITQNPCEPCCLKTPEVLEKIRDAIAELAGAEDDTNPLSNEPLVKEINNQIRLIRKDIWRKKLAFGQGKIEDITEIAERIKTLTDKIYEEYTSKNYEPLIEQLIKEIEPPKKQKQNIKKLAEPTPEEIEEELHKQMVKQYARVYSP